MENIYNWVKNIVFFLVLITIINNLVGSSKYKKYINLISGMILIILVLNPLFDLFDIDEKIDYNIEKNTFISESKSGFQGISPRMTDPETIDKINQIEEIQMTSILEKYKVEVKNKTAQLLEDENLFIVEFDVVINEDEASGYLGEIKQMDLVASYTVNNEDTTIEPIKKIEINKVEIGDNVNTEIEENDNNKPILSEKEISIKNLLSDFYNVDPNNINISIEE